MLSPTCRIRLVMLLWGVSLVAASTHVSAQTNPFVGVWELDRFKSVYEPIDIQPTKQVLTIAAAPTAGQFTATTRTWRLVNNGGEVANETSYTAAFDGKEYPTSAARATVTFKQI